MHGPSKVTQDGVLQGPVTLTDQTVGFPGKNLSVFLNLSSTLIISAQSHVSTKQIFSR